MISLIICSRTKELSTKLKENIKATIGIEYELVIIDNSNNDFSIFSAYNQGFKRAKYPYLCFMHEDILYHTQNWGERVVSHFQRDEKIGLIGVVGTHFIPKIESYWCDTSLLSGSLIQGWFENGTYITERVKHDDYAKGATFIEAAAVDGLWFVVPRSMFSQILFDNKKYSGFHFYEMDTCMQVMSCGYKVVIIMDILIEHFSYGNGDNHFNRARKIFYEKWKKHLPIVVGISLNNNEIRKITRNLYKYKQRQTALYRFLKKYIIK